MSLEELELDVAVKLAFVENSLSRVEECCKQLQDNAQKIKDQIHGAVEKQVLSLRGRERQLIRQVEVVTAHQSCLLGTQQANLVHSKGALTATHELLQRCSSSDTSTLNKIKVDDSISSQITFPVNFVSVQLDAAAISSAVAEFGQVQLPDSITHQSSSVIPAKVEEYEDAQHDVLHKSVAGETAGPLRVTVTFPRLANLNWLAKEKKPAKSNNSSMLNIVDKMNSQGQSGDVTSWLSNLHLAGSQEEDDSPSTPNSLDSYDIVPNRASNSVRTSECSSIEVVSSLSDSNKNECTTPQSVCEIENLHHHIGEKSRWLSQKPDSLSKLCLDNVKTESVCQANEMCSSFSSCLFSNNCGEAALEKAKQSANFKARMCRKRTHSKTENVEQVLAHMANIQRSDNSQWLFKRVGSPSLPRPVKRAMYELPAGMWLRETSATSASTSPRIVLPNHSNIWLLSKLKSQKEKMNQEKDKSEIEKDEDEKESQITAKDLASALEKVSVSPLTDTPTYSFGIGNSTADAESWLFHKKLSHGVLAHDNKLFEIGCENKKRWLVYSNTRNSAINIGSTSSLPESVLGVAKANLNNWLLKRLQYN